MIIIDNARLEDAQRLLDNVKEYTSDDSSFIVTNTFGRLVGDKWIAEDFSPSQGDPLVVCINGDRCKEYIARFMTRSPSNHFIKSTVNHESGELTLSNVRYSDERIAADAK